MDNNAREKIEAMKKSTVVAYLLWFFLGGFGLHRFYSRKPFGWIYIILLVLGLATVKFGIGFLFFLIISIWWVVDAFFIYQWIEKHNLKLVSSLEQQDIVNQKHPPKVATEKKVVSTSGESKESGQSDEKPSDDDQKS